MPLPPDSVLLDTTRPGPGDTAGALLFARPAEVLTAHTLGGVPALLADLDRRAAAGRWLAGYLTYEAGYAFEHIASLKPGDGPLGWFGVYDAPQRLAPEEADALLADAGDFEISTPAFALDRADYAGRIAAIRSHIREGDVYQVNLTAPFRFRFDGDPAGLYAALRRRQRVGFGALARAGERWVLSASPELFFRREGDRITTRPMKGTARRGPTPEEDAAQAAWLTADPKNRAENLMIVDLLRNDLSVVAEPGSVHVPALFEPERYDTLWQMTSTVEATLRPGIGTADLFRALFPCGSVTGAPKIRAMQVIHRLEDGPRGVYCGAIGYVSPEGRAAFSVPIRTVELHGADGRMGSGSGVVWDSDPDAEYDECLLKARFLTAPAPPAFALLETMRWEDGVALLGRHLARLRRSAGYFGFPFDEAAVRGRLAEVESGLEPGTAVRIRLTLGPKGEVGIEAGPLAAPPFRRAVVYPEPADPSDPFQRHKTTHRDFYERAYGWAQERGFDEALLVNVRGEVVEGTRTNVFVRRGGRLVTPPLAVGGLGGVYRAHLLATEGADEEVLTIADLCRADAVYLSNAVRGLSEVAVTDAP